MTTCTAEDRKLRIFAFSVKNYRSLHNVELNNLGNFVVFIGKNSSGKSNLLEAMNLFFTDFSLTGGTTAGLNDYFWFKRRTYEPIEFRVVLEMTDEEVGRLIPKQLLDAGKVKLGEHNSKIFEIHREVNKDGAWKTQIISWGLLPVVTNDRPLTPQETVSSKEWTKEGLTPNPQQLSTLQKNLQDAVKGRFKLIAAVRDTKNPQPNRITLLDNNVQTRLWTLEQSTNPVDEEKYSEFENLFSEISGLRLDPAQGQIFTKRGATRFPLYLEGGGIQGCTNLLFDLLLGAEGQFIYGIEEPESHSHPGLQRRMLETLRTFRNSTQMFLVTHSPNFVGSGELSEKWLVKQVKDETEVVRSADLSNILKEIGVRPADILFSNRIIFVEGPSDKIALTAFASKLGISLDNVDLVPLRGKSNAERALSVWLSFTRGGIPIFAILDNDASSEVHDVIQKGLIEKDRIHVWKNGSIEDYYPTEIFEKALSKLNERYSLQLNVEEIVNKISAGQLRPDRIDIGPKASALDKSWEVVLAEEFVRQLSAEEKPFVSEELKDALETAATIE